MAPLQLWLQSLCYEKQDVYISLTERLTESEGLLWQRVPQWLTTSWIIEMAWYSELQACVRLPYTLPARRTMYIGIGRRRSLI
jgi:hypothetical protein